MKKPHSFSTFLLHCLLVASLSCCALFSFAQEVESVDAELRDLLKKTITESDSFVDRYDAEVWLVTKSHALEKYIADPEERLTLLRKIHRAALQADLQPEWVLAVIEIESAFDSYAISSAGALGMMQVMPFWTKEIGRPDDNLINLDTNLRYGCTILKFYLDKAEGRMHEALARYNGSYGKYWYPQKVMMAWEKRWR
jgi:soluble lytic murein transglycosylase-like protein